RPRGLSRLCVTFFVCHQSAKARCLLPAFLLRYPAPEPAVPATQDTQEISTLIIAFSSANPLTDPYQSPSNTHLTTPETALTPAAPARNIRRQVCHQT